MSEIIILEGEEAKKIRLKRAEGLSKLFDSSNGLLLNGLKSLLAKIEYENSQGKQRDVADENRRLASSFMNRIQTEINWAMEELKKEEKEKK